MLEIAMLHQVQGICLYIGRTLSDNQEVLLVFLSSCSLNLVLLSALFTQSCLYASG